MDPKTSPDEDSYSIIERLADAIRIEDDVRLTPEDRARLVQDLYEGPRKCACCINWVTEVPVDVDLEAVERDDDSHPLILRRNVLPGEARSNTSVHSIEVRNPEAREVLFEVFQGFDGIVPEVKYLIFLAPFKQFFWRWAEFERAIEAQRNETVRGILVQLRAIVKAELAEAFAVSKELVSHGVITHKYLWTIFPPGELVFARRYDGDRFFILSNSSPYHSAPIGHGRYDLQLVHIDWDGYIFGWAREQVFLSEFKGTKRITELCAYPARFCRDLDTAREACINRGRKFNSLGGIQYKAYTVGDRVHRRDDSDSDSESDAGSESEVEAEEDVQSISAPPAKPQLDRRIILDARGRRPQLTPIGRKGELDGIRLSTGFITQAPIDATPPGGHQPLPLPGFPPMQPGQPYAYPQTYFPQPARVPRYDDRNIIQVESQYTPPPPPPRNPHLRPRRSIESLLSSDSEDEDSFVPHHKKPLSEFHLLLCSSRIWGYCLKQKGWRSFRVERIVDIEWNTTPFESLVLPDGYKDLILSFVESQIKNGDTFDDVINGKGGGLVILLAGDPGVGKTLTAESVAEKIQAPLYKMELGQINDNEEDDPHLVPKGNRGNSTENHIVQAFELAARWKAVLLIDECDLYLEKRSDSSPKRNRMVSRFLQQLEYYPSLLFLTTNREKVLDPAIYSRIHLTINYPALDLPSRAKIWDTFLEHDGAADVSAEERAVLADLDFNGRKIRNVVKTARIMAKQRGTPVCFDDIKKVMRITEGVIIQ